VVWILAGAGAGGAIVVMLGLLVFYRRRHRHRGGPSGPSRALGAAAVLLAVLGSSATLVAVARPAAASTAEVDGSIRNDFGQCMATFAAAGDPGGVLAGLAKYGSIYQVLQTFFPQLQAEYNDGDGGHIYWDPNDTIYFSDGVESEKCTALYHELEHLADAENGTLDTGDCYIAGPNGVPVDSGIAVSEVAATRAENALRAKLGLPQRENYGNTKLPVGECVKVPWTQKCNTSPCAPPRVSCLASPCGDTNGDPHLRTLDGARFDFQGAGEFVASVDPRGGFQIQVRQQPYTASRTIAVTTATAMDVAGDRVELDVGQYGPTLLANGVVATGSSVALPHGGTVVFASGMTSPVVTTTWPDASVVTTTQIGTWGLHLVIQPAADRAGAVQGLLGDADGNPANDIRPAGGAPITSPSFSTLYPDYANSWRIAQTGSLFSYTAGTSTTTYTDPSFPHAATSVRDVSNLAAVRAACVAAGVTDPQTLLDCELDVGMTGLVDFAAALGSGSPAGGASPSPPTSTPTPTSAAPTSTASTGPQAPGTILIDGPPVTASVASPGASVTLTFVASAGDKVFVQISGSTFPDACSLLRIVDVTGNVLASGCTTGSSGYIDETTLPSGGPAVTATISQPGAVARLTFSANGGDKVFVQLSSSTFGDSCGLVRIVNSANHDIALGCVRGGSGDVDGTVLPDTGTYAVVVDGSGSELGSISARIIRDTDQVTPVTVGGPAVTAAISQPGAVARLTFTANGGDKVTVEVSGSTFPDSCGLVRIVNSSNDDLAIGCVKAGVGSVTSTVLTDGAAYAVLVKPDAATDLGSVAIRVVRG
jgi:hypothetical protein